MGHGVDNRQTTYLDIPHCSSLLEWFLFFFPGAVTVLTSGNSKLCPASNRYFGVHRIRDNTQVATQGVSLAITKGTWISLPCTKEDESVAEIPGSTQKLSFIRIAHVQLRYHSLEHINLSSPDSTLL